MEAAAAAVEAAKERPRRAPAKTMLGISPEAAVGLQRLVAEHSAEASSEAKAAPAPAPAPAAPAPSSSNASAASEPKAKPMARTMLGLASPAEPAPGLPGMMKNTLHGMSLPEKPAAPAYDPAIARNPDRGGVARTMLGMAPLGSTPPAPNPPDPPAAGPAGVGGRTMLGVPHGAAEAQAAGSPAAPGGRTMLGVPAGAEPAAPQSPAPAPAAPPPRAPVADPPRRAATPRRDIRNLRPLIAATIVVVLLMLVLVLRGTQAPEVAVSAKIVSSDAGEALLFEVPSAPEGSKIRFGGQEKPLKAGRASFALAADSLRVGDNLVLAEVIRPDAEPAPVRITLAVFYRIWVDTAPLRGERSALDVVVTALPGTQVTLDGDELRLDAAGRGVRSYPIDVVGESKNGAIEHVVRYRVQPPNGETVVDELRTRIPVAMMQIDRPGREVLTDKGSIEIAGAVGKDTQVRVDDTPIPVKDGRFLHRLVLPEPGEYAPRIVATAPGKAPMGITLSIKRVRDLAQAAAQFTPVPDLTYAKLAPNPVIYRGQKIALEGRVYAVDPRGADSVIQMFVRPCPSSRRCPLWVSDPHATEVAPDAWVRVLGVVEGEQQFRSEKNEIVTVPKMEAQFVIPIKP